MLYTSLFVWEMSVRWDWFVMWILMSSVGGWFFDDRIAGNAWFYWEKWEFVKRFFGYFMKIFWENFVIFDQVRLKPYFSRAERRFLVELGDFWCGGKGRKWRKMGVLSNSVSNSKWGLRRGNIRYAVPGNRTFVLKCKPTPSCAGYIANKRS